MMYANIKYNDVANGEGVRTTLFVSGCEKRCKGCQNPEAWSFDYGKPFTNETIFAIEKSLDKPWVKGVTLCGGEPLHPVNAEEIIMFAYYIKRRFHGDKDVWCYTGYSFEELPKRWLENIDVLVDGEYIDTLKDPSLWFKGSTNQRIIDVQESLKKGTIILWKSK